MNAANLFVLILTLIPLFNSVLVESAITPLENDNINNDIIGRDKKDLTPEDLVSITTIDSNDRTLDAIYNKFLSRKDAIKTYINAAMQPSPPGTTNDAPAGRKALLIFLAAFETITSNAIKDDTDFEDSDKTAKIDEILAVPFPFSTSPDKKMFDLLSTTEKPFAPGTDYDMADLFGAAHRVRLFLPDSISGAATVKQIQAFRRLSQLINSMVKGASDYNELPFSVAMAKEINVNNKEPLFHYKPTTERDSLLELERQYSRNKLLLDPDQHNPPTPAGADRTELETALSKLQEQYRQLLPDAIKKAQKVFQSVDDSEKLVLAIFSQLTNTPDVQAVKDLRDQILKDLTPATAQPPATTPVPEPESALAVQEAYLYALLDAADYAGTDATGANKKLEEQQKNERKPAIHEVMRLKRLKLHQQPNPPNYIEWLELNNQATKKDSTDKLMEKTKILTTAKDAITAQAIQNNDQELNDAIDQALKENIAQCTSTAPPPPPNPQPQPAPAPNPQPQPAPAPAPAKTPEVEKALESEFDNSPPSKVPADQCQDIGSNCGNIVRMCGIPFNLGGAI